MLDRWLIGEAKGAGCEVTTRSGPCGGYRQDPPPGGRHGVHVAAGEGFVRHDVLLCPECVQEPIRQKEIMEGIFWDSSSGD